VKAYISKGSKGACLTIRDKSDRSQLWCRYDLVRKLGTYIVEGDPYLSDSIYVINETDKTLLVAVHQEENHPTETTVAPNETKSIEINKGDARLTVKDKDQPEYFWRVNAPTERGKEYIIQGDPGINQWACNEITFENMTNYTVKVTMVNSSEEEGHSLAIPPQKTQPFQIDNKYKAAYFTFRDYDNLKMGWGENILIPKKGTPYKIEGPPTLKFP
jgi:hypothetical protein